MAHCTLNHSTLGPQEPALLILAALGLGALAYRQAEATLLHPAPRDSLPGTTVRRLVAHRWQPCRPLLSDGLGASCCQEVPHVAL